MYKILYFTICVVFLNSCYQKELKVLALLKQENLKQNETIEKYNNQIIELESDKKRLEYKIENEKGNKEREIQSLKNDVKELESINDILRKGVNIPNSSDFPITNGFEIWWEFGMYISFNSENYPVPKIDFPTVINIHDKNDFLKDRIFRENNLYAFILNELADINWDSNFGDYEPPLESIKKPGKAAEIFDKVAAFHVGYVMMNDYIALTHVNRETGHLVGVIKPVEKFKTKFNVPLTVNTGQNLFGRPSYYIVEKDESSENNKIVINVYRMEKGHFLMIFYEGILQGICYV